MPWVEVFWAQLHLCFHEDPPCASSMAGGVEGGLSPSLPMPPCAWDHHPQGPCAAATDGTEWTNSNGDRVPRQRTELTRGHEGMCFPGRERLSSPGVGMAQYLQSGLDTGQSMMGSVC